MVNIGNDWDDVLREEFSKGYYLNLRQVILGQDPYHEPGQAHGLAFSVQPGVPEPPSLQNIFKELHEDVGFEIPPKGNGCLIPWAKSGVLLLNTALTVRAHQANSHRGKGWEQLTDRVIELLNEREKPIVFILWGSNATDYGEAASHHHIGTSQSAVRLSGLLRGKILLPGQ